MRGWIAEGARAAGGTALIVAAVVWLSGGCGEKVEPGEVDVGAERGGGTAARVERSVGPGVEWASGAVESARRTAVAARILARIEAVNVRAGSEVQEGDVLVVLDARDLDARVREVHEALRGARARLELARAEKTRVDKLIAEGVATRARLDQVTSALDVASAEFDRLEQSRREAETALSHTEIRSPVSGRVVDRLAEPGDTTVPGRPLLRIYDPSVLRVEAPVRESLAVRLRVGAPLRVEVPAIGETFDGVIDEIVPFAEPGARTLLVKVRLPPDARLFAGLFARMAIPAGAVERLTAPAAAVERVGQLEFVMVEREDGTVGRRLVTTGAHLDEGRVEVLSGLAAGERLRVPAHSTD
jgi:RND family efflux transporter MFP subunit